MKGITLLSTLINEDYNNYYNWKSYQIRFDAIRNRLLKLKMEMGYSDKLIKVIERMLDTDEFTRIGITELVDSVGGSMFSESYVSSYSSMKRGGLGGGDFLDNINVSQPTKEATICLGSYRDFLLPF